MSRRPASLPIARMARYAVVAAAVAVFWPADPAHWASAEEDASDQAFEGGPGLPGAPDGAAGATAPTGAAAASVTILSDAANSPSFVLSLSGTGVTAAVISVSPASVDFGVVLVTTTSTQSIIVTNQGGATLLIPTITPASLDCPGVFTASESSLSIAPGASVALGVSFTPITSSSCNGTLTLLSNDPLAPSTVITLSGTGSTQGASFATFVENEDGSLNSPSNPVLLDPDNPGQVSVIVGVKLSGFSGRVNIEVFEPIPANISIVGPEGDVLTVSPDAILFFNPGQNTLEANFTIEASTGAASGLVAIQIGAFQGNTLVSAPIIYICIDICSGPSVREGQTVTLREPAAAEFSLATLPATSEAAPALLPADAEGVTFLNVSVSAASGFHGTVRLSLARVPPGIVATLVPSVIDFSASPLQTARLELRVAPDAAAAEGTAGTGAVTITAASSTHTAELEVFAARPGESSAGDASGAPHVLELRPAEGRPGSYVHVLVLGESLTGIRQALSDSPDLSAAIEPGATSAQLQLVVFIRPGARPGLRNLMLIGPRGSVPVSFDVLPMRFSDEVLDRDTPLESGRRLGERGRDDGPLTKADLIARTRGDGFDGADGASLGMSRMSVTAVLPGRLEPGATREVRLVGVGLDAAREVRVSGAGITADIVELSESSLRVRFTVDAGAAAGSRILTVAGARESAATTVEISGARAADAAPSSRRDTPADAAPGTESAAPAADRTAGAELTSAARALPDLVVRTDDFTMSPAFPRPGETVNFRVRVSNEGAVAAEGVTVEFSLGGTGVRTRETATLAAGASQSFTFEWTAAGTGRITPQVAIDPESRVSEVTRANNSAALPFFEMGRAGEPSAPSRTALAATKAQLEVTVGGCIGYRFGAGTEAACGAGADVELRLASEGGTLRLEAEGVRNLGMVTLDQAKAGESAVLAAAEAVQTGATYLVQSSRGTALVRVVEVRGLEAARQPAALRAPKLSDVDASDPRGAAPASSGAPKVTLVLEWKIL